MQSLFHLPRRQGREAASPCVVCLRQRMLFGGQKRDTFDGQIGLCTWTASACAPKKVVLPVNERLDADDCIQNDEGEKTAGNQMETETKSTELLKMPCRPPGWAEMDLPGTRPALKIYPPQCG